MIRRKAAMILIVCSHISANHSELVSMEPIFFQNTESFLQSLKRLKKMEAEKEEEEITKEEVLAGIDAGLKEVKLSMEG